MLGIRRAKERRKIKRARRSTTLTVQSGATLLTCRLAQCRAPQRRCYFGRATWASSRARSHCATCSSPPLAQVKRRDSHRQADGAAIELAARSSETWTLTLTRVASGDGEKHSDRDDANSDGAASATEADGDSSSHHSAEPQDVLVTVRFRAENEYGVSSDGIVFKGVEHSVAVRAAVPTRASAGDWLPIDQGSFSDLPWNAAADLASAEEGSEGVQLARNLIHLCTGPSSLASTSTASSMSPSEDAARGQRSPVDCLAALLSAADQAALQAVLSQAGDFKNWYCTSATAAHPTDGASQALRVDLGGTLGPAPAPSLGERC